MHQRVLLALFERWGSIFGAKRLLLSQASANKSMSGMIAEIT
jgi:hypothetical protein